MQHRKTQGRPSPCAVYADSPHTYPTAHPYIKLYRVSLAIPSTFSLYSHPAHLGYILHINSAQRRTAVAAATVRPSVRQSVGCELSSRSVHPRAVAAVNAS